MAASPSDSNPELTDPSEAPGLPGLRTWSVVYWFVTFTFILWVVLLYVLGRMYS